MVSICCCRKALRRPSSKLRFARCMMLLLISSFSLNSRRLFSSSKARLLMVGFDSMIALSAVSNGMCVAIKLMRSISSWQFLSEEMKSGVESSAAMLLISCMAPLIFFMTTEKSRSSTCLSLMILMRAESLASGIVTPCPRPIMRNLSRARTIAVLLPSGIFITLSTSATTPYL